MAGHVGEAAGGGLQAVLGEAAVGGREAMVVRVTGAASIEVSC